MRLLKYTKKLYSDKNIRFIIISFVIWRLYLLLIAFLSTSFIPLRGEHFLGGGIRTYVNAPWFFGWANFDGEHYLSIAYHGYKFLEQSFFPVYPILINLLSRILGQNINGLVLSGLIISNLSFLAALIMLWKLLILDYPAPIIRLTIISIFVFPTSFYFGSVYNESLFLLLTVTSFYLIRKNKWFWAALLGIFSSGTRIFGMFLAPAFLIEAWQRRIHFIKFFWIFFIPLGLLGYIYYQWISVDDPLAFYHLQKIVGPQHESGITLLPQVYFRYVKMLLTTEISNPIYQTIILELFIGVLFFLLPIYGYFKKMRFSYLFFSLAGFLLPTIQGSFSSVPRYILIFFPSFLALAILVNKLPTAARIIIMLLSIVWLTIEAALFIRGYWVA